MKQLKFIVLAMFLLCASNAMAQVVVAEDLIISDTIKSNEIDPLTPSKAAFYSAVLPGLGQAYNKKYWKIPIVFGAIGASIYSYSWNNTEYHNFRDAYKKRLAGEPETEFAYLDNGRLISAQRFHQRNRDLSLLVAVAFYVLNIVDANIDAHLMQFNVDENLSIGPEIYQDEKNYKPNVALTLNYSF